ncbi:MAG: iron ABC transporter permease [archaeon]|nr:iron ABC transporter permease [archaeon]
MSGILEWLNSDTGGGKKREKAALDAIEQTEDLYSRWDDGVDEGERSLDVQYRVGILRRLAFIAACVLIMFVSAGFIITQEDGYSIDYFHVYEVLFNHILHGAPDPNVEGWDAYFDDYVVWELRFPRIAVGIVAGFGLAVAGAVMQSTMKNPMADSYTTGVSAGAAFGAALAIVLDVSVFGSDLNLLVLAFVFSLIPTMLIMFISRFRKMSATSMILIGMAIMYIFSACTTALKLWAEPDALSSLYRWQVGSLNNTLWSDFPLMFIVTVIGTVLIMFLSNRINILSSGDEGAKSLGIDAGKLRVVCLVTVSLVTASIVSYVGTIGFVGLVAPHIARLFVGSDNRYLIPAGAAFGAMLMIISDYLGRTVLSPAVLEVGVVTAFIGGPMFLWLIVRQRKEVWT